MIMLELRTLGAYQHGPECFYYWWFVAFLAGVYLFDRTSSPRSGRKWHPISFHMVIYMIRRHFWGVKTDLMINWDTNKYQSFWLFGFSGPGRLKIWPPIDIDLIWKRRKISTRCFSLIVLAIFNFDLPKNWKSIFRDLFETWQTQSWYDFEEICHSRILK